MINYKTANGIIDVRVDDRMIHGIVATQWIPIEKTTRAMLVNEAASKNDMIRATLKMATPGGVSLSVLDPQKASTNINSGKYENQRVFVVGRSIRDIYELFQNKVEMKRVNLGNVTQNMGDVTVLDKTVRVNKEELKMLKEMQDAGILITCQFLPDDQLKDLKKIL